MRRLYTEYKRDGIHRVGLARAIWADDGGEVGIAKEQRVMALI